MNFEGVTNVLEKNTEKKKRKEIYPEYVTYKVALVIVPPILYKEMLSHHHNKQFLKAIYFKCSTFCTIFHTNIFSISFFKICLFIPLFIYTFFIYLFIYLLFRLFVHLFIFYSDSKKVQRILIENIARLNNKEKRKSRLNRNRLEEKKYSKEQRTGNES